MNGRTGSSVVRDQAILASSFVAILFGFVTPFLARAQEPPALVAPTDPRAPDEERAAFRLPPGFEAQLVASEPDIAKPMNLAFDDLGRLWVTSSYEYPWPAKEGNAPRDQVTVLADFGPDGRARSVTTFADGLNIPIGVLPLSDRRALVHSIPAILTLIDDDGDGRADRRETAYASFGFRDTHGMASAFTFGLDGWIYACHGFANDSAVTGSDGQTVQFNSGNTYRIAPDGSHIEPWTRGQVNPFGLAFDALGNLYSCDCHSRPIYQLLRGAYYPSFGKPDDGLGFGPEMMTHDHGSTGIGGIAVYEADAFPAAFRGNVFIGNVVTGRINRDRLEWTGSTPAAIPEPDFLVSDDPWFRPVDIELGPDGALYVADFYNKIIGHYEVPLDHPGRDRHRGRVWRIVYTGDGADGTPAPHGSDWLHATTDELIADLAHPNLAVRTRATRLLADRDDASTTAAVRAAVEAARDPWTVAHGLWVLHRRGALDAAALARFARSPDRPVRVHLQRILAETEGWDDRARDLALAALRDDDPLVRRCAADALGRHPDPAHLRPLLDARRAADPSDTHLVHVIRMALRDQLRADSAFRGDWSESDRRLLADVAPGVPTVDSARFLLDHLRTVEEPDPTIARYVQHIARRGDAATDAALVAWARDRRPDDDAFQAALLRAAHQGWLERGAPIDGDARAWALARLDAWLAGRSVGLGIELAGRLRLVEGFERLQGVALAADAPPDARGQALAGLVALDNARAVPPLATVLNDGAADVGLREQAAVLLGQTGQPAAREALADALAALPARLQTADAAALAANREGAEALLAAIQAGKASPRLLQTPAVALRLSQSGLPHADARLAELTRDLPPAAEAADALIARRFAAYAAGPRDPERGAAVFARHCAACHQIGGVGARVGPQLDGIGARGPERLMEDILDPNRNVDQAFRASRVALTDGRVLNGLVTSDEGDALVLADAEGKLVTLRKDEVEERAVSPLSPMPANLADQIAEADFLDLIAYLTTRRAISPP